MITFCISSSEAEVHSTRHLSIGNLSELKLKVSNPDPACEAVSFLIPCILSMKKSLKPCASSFDDFPEGKLALVEPCSRCLVILFKLF